MTNHDEMWRSRTNVVMRGSYLTHEGAAYDRVAHRIVVVTCCAVMGIGMVRGSAVLMTMSVGCIWDRCAVKQCLERHLAPGASICLNCGWRERVKNAHAVSNRLRRVELFATHMVQTC